MAKLLRCLCAWLNIYQLLVWDVKLAIEIKKLNLDRIKATNLGRIPGTLYFLLSNSHHIFTICYYNLLHKNQISLVRTLLLRIKVYIFSCSSHSSWDRHLSYIQFLAYSLSVIKFWRRCRGIALNYKEDWRLWDKMVILFFALCFNFCFCFIFTLPLVPLVYA